MFEILYVPLPYVAASRNVFSKRHGLYEDSVPSLNMVGLGAHKFLLL
jgi:hypothetical protein